MAADFPELSPMEGTRKDMWKRRLGFIIEMTSGVGYSIVMHSVIITAYALLIFQIFYTNEFDLELLKEACGPIIFSYLMISLVEVGLRWFGNEDPLIVTKIGHLAHLIGSFFLYAYMVDPLNPIEGFVFFLIQISLECWTIFALANVGILALLQDDDYSLTQPLV